MDMDLDSLQIRPFESGDRALVKAFFDQMGGETRSFFDRGSGNRIGALGYFENKDRDVVRWMAVDGEKMVGYVFLWDLNCGIPWLGIAVAEDYKGRHLGRQLIETAHQYAKSKGKGGVLLTTHVANIRGQGLYERCGYERMGMHNSGEVLYIHRFK
jgi:ribosomal protein S18 acetylase RimI-like enzyme